VGLAVNKSTFLKSGAKLLLFLLLENQLLEKVEQNIIKFS
jgi:hypothetical protein